MAFPEPKLLRGNNSSDISFASETYSLTSEQIHTLQSRSASAKSTAYCPYSNFRVGSTILTNGGTYIDGANVENAAYPVGTCAERVAFGKAITEGQRGFRAIGVATDISPPASPCGMCRQFIREFCELDMPIFMFDKNGDFMVARLGELLPLSFGPEALPPREKLAEIER
ncbi:hypothetical protein BPAE_0261g00070 [Botrytis paeoniae]|uniref:Cytidine deaminase n=1 Tax=Botrytis paeoniae TaxID=278948 RepID=A0A4Z1FBG0_9HELO|nr:hypothetical protein BPAE_0261g00070 [Botrytis paeoniae]